jgi:dephospho-CoA kinase
MLRVALTGGIASGKTTVSNAFLALGVPVVDADILARQAVAIDSLGLRKVTDRFGLEILQNDGSLDRAKLREIIFSDSSARADLESIVHPEVRRLTNELINTFEQSGHPYCLIVIPLLVETGQQDRYDHIVVVDVAVETQIKRLQSRDGGTVDDAKKILNSQASRDDRLAIADDVITNNGDISGINKQVNDLHDALLKLANTPKS